MGISKNKLIFIISFVAVINIFRAVIITYELYHDKLFRELSSTIVFINKLIILYLIIKAILYFFKKTKNSNNKFVLIIKKKSSNHPARFWMMLIYSIASLIGFISFFSGACFEVLWVASPLCLAPFLPTAWFIFEYTKSDLGIGFLFMIIVAFIINIIILYIIGFIIDKWIKKNKSQS